MPAEKLEAYLRQMPWLKKWLESERAFSGTIRKIGGEIMPVRQIFVSGFGLELWDYVPTKIAERKHTEHGSTIYFEDPQPVSDINLGETIYFVDEEGDVVSFEAEWAHPVARHILLFWLFWCKPELKKEKTELRALVLPYSDHEVSIGMKLNQIGKEKMSLVRYMVSYCGYTQTLIVYRAPGGAPIWGRLVELYKESEASRRATVEEEVRGEIAATDYR